MKIVVFGPERRVGALRDGVIVDLCGAFAKYAWEKNGDPRAMALAEALVPADLARFIDGGPRTLDSAEQAIEYLLREAHDRRDRRGSMLVHSLAETRLHAPRPSGARIACAGGNFADHAAAMAEKMQAASLHRRCPRAASASNGIWGFWKVNRAAVRPDGEVIYPAKATRLDYEGELAIVIGKRGIDIKAGRCKRLHLGRDPARRLEHPRPARAGRSLRFAMGKNFDTLGARSARASRLARPTRSPPTSRRWSTASAGSTSTPRDMVFSFAEYLEYLSARSDALSRRHHQRRHRRRHGGRFEPAACRTARSPPDRFLKPGDSVEVRSPAVGSLRARIVAKNEGR